MGESSNGVRVERPPNGDLESWISTAERLDSLGAEVRYLPDPSYDRLGRRSFPITETFRDPNGEGRVTLHAFRREGDRSVLSHARTLPPGTGRFAAHRHLDYEEQWLVYSGTAGYKQGRERGTLVAGEKLILPPGTPHVDPYNDSDEPLELLGLISPPNSFTFHYGRTHGDALRAGRVNGQQQLTPLHLMLVLRETRAGTYAAGPPIPIQRLLVIPLLAALARLRGYRMSTW
jgi:mannose-6-phosphate isomerase-like protein (cupin superfamily)